jgi:hypothetical protein
LIFNNVQYNQVWGFQGGLLLVVELDYLPDSEVLFQPCLDPVLDKGVWGDCPPTGAPLVGVSGEAPPKRNFWENFLVKYCNFVVNLNRSSLGCRYDGRSYVRVFFSLEGNPLLCMRELYCG